MKFCSLFFSVIAGICTSRYVFQRVCVGGGGAVLIDWGEKREYFMG